ncbi:MAG: hypothetical protein GY866_20325 [Proteobacteria bacterium]|nr:hypothetical protein [Pseudomonadota bacterium]
MIPFKYGVVVSGKDFCGRSESIEEIKTFVLSSQNIYIQGERRIGKTSLVFETIKRMKSHRLLVIDLLALRTPEELCSRIIKQLILLENKASFLGNLVAFFTHLRPQISMDPLTNLPAVTFDRAVSVTPESIEEIFELIGTISRKKKMVVFFDEFQDILKIEDAPWLLATLRSRIQYHDRLSYIYAGSIRNEMDAIFSDSESPFFKSAIPVTISSIEQEVFSRFITSKFKRAKRLIKKEVLTRIFEIAAHISGDILQLCEALWSVSSANEVIDEDTIPEALQLIFAREQRSYEIILGGLSINQQKALTGLAKNPGCPLNSSDFLKLSGIGQPSSVNAALKKLVDRRIVFRKANSYSFSNPFFAAWLKSFI